MSDTAIDIRPVTPDDIPTILDFVRALAAYEREPDAVVATETSLHEALFGPKPAAEAVIARVDGQPAGLALWFQNFSTWTGRPGLWLEDLFVYPDYRRRGVARALFVHLARLCRDRNYSRLEWSVLNWNQLALDFYASLAAEPMSEWTTQRLSGKALDRLAGD